MYQLRGQQENTGKADRRHDGYGNQAVPQQPAVLLRVLAAVLVLCFSLLCPAASAASVQTAACKPSTAAVQTISAGKKTEQMVWVPTHGGKKYHSKSTCSNMKDPEKVTLSKAKAEGFTACKKCY